MKKTIQFLLVITAFLLVSYNSNAGANSLPAASPIIEKTINKGGGLPIVIIVSDAYGNPIVGAECNAPCSGLPTQYTDSNGEAIFKITGTCGCHNSTLQVICSYGQQRIPVTCGNNYNVDF